MNSQNAAVWDESSGTAFPYVDHVYPSLWDGSPDLRAPFMPTANARTALLAPAMFEPPWRVEVVNQRAPVPRGSTVGTSQQLGLGVQDRKERSFERIIGHSSALEAVLEQVERVAPAGSTVLIQGETGTGKELIAQAVHNISSRCGRPFVRLNCAAIPLDLLESELFGHEKGAFTGAIAQKIGRF